MKALVLAVSMTCAVAMSSEAQAGKAMTFVKENVLAPVVFGVFFGGTLISLSWVLPRPEIKIDQQYIDYHEQLKKTTESLKNAYIVWETEDRMLRRRIDAAIESGNIIVVESKP